MLISSLLAPYYNVTLLSDLALNVWATSSYTKLEIVPSLLGVFGLIAAEGYRQIAAEIETALHVDNKSGTNDPCRVDDLKTWKIKHLLLYDYVSELNRTFNFLLLMEICHVFISLTVTTSNICNSFTSITLYYGLIVMKNAVVLFLLCYISGKIRNAVTSSSPYFNRDNISINDLSCRQQALVYR